jgi:hypothetical protein
MCNFADRFKWIENYSGLGTGREKQKVLIGTTQDARTARFLALTTVEQNRPSWKRLKLRDRKSGKAFFIDTATRSINGERVFLFRYNDSTRDLWLKHVERQKYYCGLNQQHRMKNGL